MKTVTGAIPSGGFYRVDLLQISLPNGQYIRAVMGGDGDVAWNGNTYYAVQDGVWSRGTVEAEAMANLSSKSLDLTVLAPDTAVFPGTAVPMASSFTTGAWDGAAVGIVAAYMALGAYGAVVASMALWGGMVSALSPSGRGRAKLACQDWLYLANIEVPRRVIQPGCFATFGDAACGFALASFGFANTVSAASTPVQIVPASAWPASDSRGNSLSGSFNGNGYFAAGKVQWSSGNNKGYWSHVAAQSGSTLILAQAPPFAAATGDQFTAYPGCQKTLTDCTTRWGNEANHLGMPWVPPPEQSV